MSIYLMLFEQESFWQTLINLIDFYQVLFEQSMFDSAMFGQMLLDQMSFDQTSSEIAIFFLTCDYFSFIPDVRK